MSHENDGTYWEHIIKHIFPEAEELEESWNKKTITFKLKKAEKVAGKLNMTLSPQKRQLLQKHFGPDWEISIDGHTTNQVSGSTETTLKIVLSHLSFQKRPRP